MISDFFTSKKDIEQARQFGILDEKNHLADKLLELSKKLEAKGVPANLETMSYTQGYMQAVRDVLEVIRP